MIEVIWRPPFKSYSTSLDYVVNVTCESLIVDTLIETPAQNLILIDTRESFTALFHSTCTVSIIARNEIGESNPVVKTIIIPESGMCLYMNHNLISHFTAMNINFN